MEQFTYLQIFLSYFNYKYTWDSQLNKAFMNDRQ